MGDGLELHRLFQSPSKANRRIPAEILGDEELNSFIATRLPRTHDFEAGSSSMTFHVC